MDLSKYKELTGINVPAGRAAYMQAQINRATAMLETMLGFTLNPEKITNLYNEVGKTRDECACPSVAIEDASLEDPDEVTGAYRLFPYNKLDQYLHIDPFNEVYKVKLVWIKQGAGNDGVTLRTFDTDRVRVNAGRDGLKKYLELCRDCFCECGCSNCVQLAVDADWLWDEAANIPDELLYVLADMVTYYSDQKRNVKSESITTHSYTKFDKTAPEAEPYNLSVIKKYAGPHGSVSVMPTYGAAGRRVHPWL